MMYEYKAKVIRVIDGDTMVCDVDLGFSITIRERIRLRGINTPEVRGTQKKRGLEVKEIVRSMIEGKEITLQVYKKGKYGRFIADIIINDITLSDYLLVQGLGEKYD